MAKKNDTANSRSSRSTTKTSKSTKTATPARSTKTKNTVAPKRATRARTSVTHDDIARRAYDFFLARGCEHGRDVEDWLRAEAELRS